MHLKLETFFPYIPLSMAIKTIKTRREIIKHPMNLKQIAGDKLAASITKTASKQTYYTIRFFADRELVDDAYRAYAYFRWVDDALDEGDGTISEKTAFLQRQKELLNNLYLGKSIKKLCAEEELLAVLVHNDDRKNPGLYSYLHNMMSVMEFDAVRCNRLTTQKELDDYTFWLATAVTDAMFYFIGHNQPAEDHPEKYSAVTAAHITHMLRDGIEDINSGYFNISKEYLQKYGIDVFDVDNQTYHKWVCKRVKLARARFKAGHLYLDRVNNIRRRLAGYAYTARFEWILREIERDNYCLRVEYPQRKSISAGLWMGWSALTSMLAGARLDSRSNDFVPLPLRIED